MRPERAESMFRLRSTAEMLPFQGANYGIIFYLRRCPVPGYQRLSAFLPAKISCVCSSHKKINFAVSCIFITFAAHFRKAQKVAFSEMAQFLIFKKSV